MYCLAVLFLIFILVFWCFYCNTNHSNNTFFFFIQFTIQLRGEREREIGSFPTQNCWENGVESWKQIDSDFFCYFHPHNMVWYLKFEFNISLIKNNVKWGLTFLLKWNCYDYLNIYWDYPIHIHIVFFKNLTNTRFDQSLILRNE